MQTYTQDELRWAVNEVERQGAGPEAVLHFLAAWDYAKGEFFPYNKDTLDLQIRFVNELVRGQYPIRGQYPNGRAYRETPVVFANGNKGAPWQEVPRLMDRLCESNLLWTNPDSFAIEFLNIHPFEDGNGRTASIIMNRRMLGLDGGMGDAAHGWTACYPFREIPEPSGWVNAWGSEPARPAGWETQSAS